MEVLDATNAEGQLLPFAVSGSQQVHEVEGELMPLRQYPWGTCFPRRKEHSDAVVFRLVS